MRIMKSIELEYILIVVSLLVAASALVIFGLSMLASTYPGGL